MYLQFAWRYFRAKKSANAINIIAWVTTGVIAFATCCQVLVLSVFNGFEDLVRSLYSSFYSDIRIVPAKGKTLELSPDQLHRLKAFPFITNTSLVAEEKALIKNGDAQSVVFLKGVDSQYRYVSGVSSKITRGKYNLGNIDEPKIVVGSGVQQAGAIIVNDAFMPEDLTIILPKLNTTTNDPLESISEGNVSASGVFSIQQEFDNHYAVTNLEFMKQQMTFLPDQYSAVEMRIRPGTDMEEAKLSLAGFLGKEYRVLSRYEQNTNLYNTMKMEKWAIFAVLTLILIIAAFNMISALTMLVLEKKRDIAILQSMGSTRTGIRRIFLTEGMLLGVIGAAAGILLAVVISLLQLKFHIIKLGGGSFLIDYFPVKLVATDFLLVSATALFITFVASWFPAYKASRQPLNLR